MKIKLCTLVLFLCQLITLSQTDEINHRKYWYYRSRLTNDFMKIGSNPGESLPMSTRAKYGFYYGTTDGACELGTDAVSQLGPYICVLATEYRLLADNNQSTDSTLRELYYALDAFNRLDGSAEAVYGYPSGLNGFFIRQDIPKTFVTDNIKHFNYDLNLYTTAQIQADPNLALSPGFCSPSHNINLLYQVDPVAFSAAEPYCRWLDNPTQANKKSVAMSLDQVINMFNGCALINKLFPLGVAYKINGVEQAFLDGKTDIRAEARAISHRMLNALQGQGDWKIRLPDGSVIPIDDGGHAFPYSFAFSEADCKIQGNPTQLNSSLPCLGSQNILGATAGFSTWEGLTSAAGISFDILHPDNAQKTVGLEAGCNCVYGISGASILIGFVQSVVSYVIGWIQHWIYGDPVPVYEWQQIVFNETEQKIENRMPFFNLQWAPLLRKVLHGGGNESYNTFNYPGFLNSAPCDGPRYFNDGNDPAEERWSSKDNIDHAYQIKDVAGEFNGLDYMLYHNLYYLDNPGMYTGPTDLRYREIPIGLAFPFQYNGVNFGSNAAPVVLPGYEFIVAEGSINAVNPSNPSDPNNGNVTYRAGKKINLKPGFKVSNGAFFNGKIQKFTCGGDNDVHRTSGTDSTKKIYSYFDDKLYTKSTKYVKQPKRPEEFETKSTLQPTTNASVKTKRVIQNKIYVYPNPSNGVFNLSMIIRSTNIALLTVTDILGKEVYSKKVPVVTGQEMNEIIDIKGESRGIYLLKIDLGLESVVTQKLIIQ